MGFVIFSLHDNNINKSLRGNYVGNYVQLLYSVLNVNVTKIYKDIASSVSNLNTYKVLFVWCSFLCKSLNVLVNFFFFIYVMYDFCVSNRLCARLGSNLPAVWRIFFYAFLMFKYYYFIIWEYFFILQKSLTTMHLVNFYRWFQSTTLSDHLSFFSLLGNWPGD